MHESVRNAFLSLRPRHEPDITDPVRLLDVTRQRLLYGRDVATVVDLLSDGLWWIRHTAKPHLWRDLTNVIHAHPVLSLLHENPYVRRAFVKPRGYAGDAPMLDLLLVGHSSSETHHISNLGAMLLERDRSASFAVAVRERHRFIMRILDHISELVSMPNVLVVGGGHFWEGIGSNAVQRRRLGRVVVIDSDAEALSQVAREFSSKGIELINCSIQSITGAYFPAGSFHLIYAPCIYETLSQPFAIYLTSVLFNLLQPGGRLLVANVTVDIYDCAYLEACADWFMNYRDAQQMAELDRLIPAEEVSLKRIYTRESPEILYLEIRRRSFLMNDVSPLTK